MRRAARTTAAAVALLIALCAAAQGAFAQTIPAAPSAWVTDDAGLLSPAVRRDLNAELRAFELETGHQIVVYIAPTTGGVPIEDWAVAAFAQWKVGRKGLDDGLVLFIFTRDRTDRIEVGYGLEGAVPDARAAEILRNTIEPGLRSGDADRAVSAGVAQLLALVRAGAASAPGSEPVPLAPIDVVAIAVVFLILLVLVLRSPWLAVMMLTNIFAGGGRGSGGGWSGGGFSGGGGRSGGGGASGRW